MSQQMLLFHIKMPLKDNLCIESGNTTWNWREHLYRKNYWLPCKPKSWHVRTPWQTDYLHSLLCDGHLIMVTICCTCAAIDELVNIVNTHCIQEVHNIACILLEIPDTISQQSWHVRPHLLWTIQDGLLRTHYSYSSSTFIHIQLSFHLQGLSQALT